VEARSTLPCSACDFRIIKTLLSDVILVRCMYSQTGSSSSHEESLFEQIIRHSDVPMLGNDLTDFDPFIFRIPTYYGTMESRRHRSAT
jgi:hypothetical protein